MIPLSRAFVDLPLAHRGLHDVNKGIPENSLAAVEAAVTAGYGIEIDVQESADHAAMVFHDFTLDRMTSVEGPVKALDSDALQAVSLEANGEGIPTLSDALAVVAGRVPLLIEIKDEDDRPPIAPRPLERAVCTAIQGYPGPVAVMSFNPFAVSHVPNLSPDTPLGLTTCAFDHTDYPDLTAENRAYLQEIRAFGELGASFISHEAADLRAPPVTALKAKGVPILCWTIRSEGQELEARQVADGITFEGYAPAFP